MDLTELFYHKVMELLSKHEDKIVQKNFISKPAPLDELEINIAKGQLVATKAISIEIANLYKNFKSGLDKE